MSRERSRRILLTSGVGLAQRVAQLLSTLITLPLVLHVLGVAGFGVWAAATSLGWLSGVLDLGLGSALLTLVPESIAKGQTERIGGYVTASVTAGAGLMLAVFGVGGLAMAVGVARAPDAPFLLAGIALALNIPIGIARDLWFGLQKGYVAGYWEFAQTLLTLALLVAAVLIGGGVLAMVAAVYAAMLLTNLGSLAHVMRRHPVVRPSRAASMKSIRTVGARGSLLLAITAAGSCSYALDNIMALSWLGAVAAAQMAVAIRVCTTALGVLNIVTQPLWPEFVSALALDDHAWLRGMVRDWTAGIILLACLCAIVIAAVGQPVLSWWLHQNLQISRSLLWVMGAWIVTSSFVRVPSLLLNAVLLLRPQIVILAASAAMGFVLKFLAAKAFGVAGLLGATPVLWTMLVGPSYFWLAWRAAGTRGAGVRRAFSRNG